VLSRYCPELGPVIYADRFHLAPQGRDLALMLRSEVRHLPRDPVALHLGPDAQCVSLPRVRQRGVTLHPSLLQIGEKPVAFQHGSVKLGVRRP